MVALIYLNGCVFGLSTDAGGPMGVLGIRDSVCSRRRVLYV